MSGKVDLEQFVDDVRRASRDGQRAVDEVLPHESTTHVMSIHR